MESMQAVTPISPAAGYIGGKRNLARRLCALIEQVGHDGYAEPFVGMGGVFLRRRSRPRVEVINDISGDVATFFRVLQEHYPYFMDLLRFRIASRNEFERLKGMDPQRLTDLQRAARFLYLQRLSFGGVVAPQRFGIDNRKGARFNVSKLEPMLADIHERLAGVLIEQLPFDRFIEKYDRPGMLFYADPPYFGNEGDYGAGVFGRDDFARLAELMRGARGKMILSINDRPEMRETFAGLDQLAVETTYHLGTHSGGALRAGELIVANFPIDGAARAVAA